jgi:hypothetical protein
MYVLLKTVIDQKLSGWPDLWINESNFHMTLITSFAPDRERAYLFAPTCCFLYQSIVLKRHLKSMKKKRRMVGYDQWLNITNIFLLLFMPGSCSVE